MFANQDDANPYNLIKTGGTNRDAIDGFADLVRGLDQHGLGEARGANFGDMLPIVLGWIVLGLVICYPATQLAAICATVIFMGCKGMWHLITGDRSDRQSGLFINQDFRPITN